MGLWWFQGILQGPPGTLERVPWILAVAPLKVIQGNSMDLLRSSNDTWWISDVWRSMGFLEWVLMFYLQVARVFKWSLKRFHGSLKWSWMASSGPFFKWGRCSVPVVIEGLPGDYKCANVHWSRSRGLEWVTEKGSVGPWRATTNFLKESCGVSTALEGLPAS